MALLQLGNTKVRLAKPDAAGHDPAPVGTSVWLDVPGGSFDFQPFKVIADPKDAGARRLSPAGGSAQAPIDLSRSYWSVWAPPGKTLTVANQFERVTDFGYPLLALLNDQGELILPNTRKLFLREFDLSGAATQVEINTSQTNTKKFYADLHVDIEFRRQTRPAGVPDLFAVDTGTRKSLHDVAGFSAKDKSKLPAVTPPFNDPPWKPDVDFDKTIILVWIKSFEGSLVHGFAAALLPLAPFNPVSSITGNLALDRSVVFVSEAGLTTLTLAHEIMHCLLADPGQGKAMIEGRDGKVPQPVAAIWTSRVKQMMTDLQLNEPDPFALLSEGIHHSLAGPNLMAEIVQSKLGDPKLLTHVQVAIARRARELRWPGEP